MVPMIELNVIRRGMDRLSIFLFRSSSGMYPVYRVVRKSETAFQG